MGECDGASPAQVYLQCFVDLWRPCVSEEECAQSGTCSDREWTQVVTSENPFMVSAGLSNIPCDHFDHFCLTFFFPL